ncbi:MFS transporter [Streptacidiphilus jiangxiensis]|uniref:Predicted arabinose efflux permease, MFS family n=1 Tax=Streptacidiphilus jiangxiensis TaxID=235985 RepID=A0A1H8AG67_STRJI|nr:MFS transporter [Streptacidiphilus jiangxiensis]SEM69755.1 Predicted arabinose efflux permease, MFS family [Streptacidiphilus jiangxiensis]
MRGGTAAARLGLRVRLREAAAPLAVPAYRLHFSARTLSSAGAAVSPIGLAFAALRIGGTASSLGWILAAGMLPQIAFQLVGGVVADRWSRARVMVWTNLVPAVAETGAAVLLWSGQARVWQLVVMSAVCGSAAAFFGPAAAGVLTEVVPAELRHSANALLRMGQNLVKVAGPALGGAVVALAGPAWAIAWDALTFAVAAALFARLGLGADRLKTASTFGQDFREGWDDFRSRHWLWIMVVQGACLVPVWLVGYELLGPVFGQRYLGGAAAWGAIVSGFTTGVVAGAALGLLWKPTRVGVVVCLGNGLLAVPLAAMSSTSWVPLLVVSTVVAGTGCAFAITTWAGLMQARVPADRLSRASAYAGLGQLAPVPVGYLIAGPLTAWIGLRPTLAAAAVLVVLAATVPLTVRHVRLLDLPANRTAAERAPARV